jgi:1-acyl-sn-glycerol-3-phosphate acyltransferase
VIALNLTFCLIPVLLLALAKGLIPALRDPADRMLDRVYRAAVAVDDAWLRGVMGIRWEANAVELARDQNVIVLSNHVSWADILLIQSLVARRGPVLKFLAKRELIFIPIFGAIFWAFDFPILRRRGRATTAKGERRRGDLEAIKEACSILESRPAALVNFAEGTRFSEQKRSSRSSPYAHLLPPKVGGLSALLDTLVEADTKILDLTIKYPQPHSFWIFLGGQPGTIEIEATIIEACAIPHDRDARSAWLAERWAMKDRAIGSFRSRDRAVAHPHPR